MIEVVPALYAVLLIACAITDFLWLRIPNVLVAALVVLFAVAVWLEPPPALVLAHIVPALVGFAIAAALFFWGKLGAGDVKLFGAVLLWVGIARMGPFLIALAVYGAIAIILFGHLNAQAGNLLIQAGAYFGRVIELPASLKTKRSIPYGIVIAAAALSIGPAIG